MEKPTFALNPVGDNFQIYGAVNGMAIKRHTLNTKTYQLTFTFFIGPKLIKIETNDKDHTIWTKDDIIKRIQKTIDEYANKGH